ncbi:NifB/NifX family molybdenum-iron cluster-binding protein [Herbinix luporum]|uniref:NifB/NifX family molybdenum-iron cluster-binding protein n=1 Tax=Herbinix luporum TaxID=1679721 RepID=UPI0023F14099|nr:NifB/NifX family molybdenum-iron cluster-binding protein [Herbinix luporum]
MRVAVASSDGIVINRHFGRAEIFYIYEIKDHLISFVEKRMGKAFCNMGEHKETDLKDTVELINDCLRVYVLQIGKGAEEALSKRGIQTVIARGLIDKVLEREEVN